MKWQPILYIILIIGAGILAFRITEKIMLINQYGFYSVFSEGIYFTETKPYIVTSKGDTLTRYHNLFHFLFPIVPFIFILFIGAILKETFIKIWKK